MGANAEIVNQTNVQPPTPSHAVEYVFNMETTQRKKHTYQYYLGDVKKICLAADKKEAMLKFGSIDANRVHKCIVNIGLVLDFFIEHTVEISAYDGSIILSFPLK